MLRTFQMALVDVGRIIDTESIMKNISNAVILRKYGATRYLTHLQNMPTCQPGHQDQRTNGPVNAHLIPWPTKAQNIQNLENI